MELELELGLGLGFMDPGFMDPCMLDPGPGARVPCTGPCKLDTESMGSALIQKAVGDGMKLKMEAMSNPGGEVRKPC